LPTKAIQINCILFNAQRKFWDLPTDATQIECIWFRRAAKNLGMIDCVKKE
jgi:hypothetical protein